MKYIIITGASRGLGEGLALALLEENNHLICVSRTHNEQLQKIADTKNCRVTQILFDLFFTEDLPLLVNKIFENIMIDEAQGVYLVNNAGVIEPVNNAEKCLPEEFERNLKINLLTPMILSGAFIRQTSGWMMQKRIMNISSGAAQTPYEGWSSYCTSKAGLNMFSRCVALEQQNIIHPVEIMSVAPGIVDTQMQIVIRETTDEQFNMRKKFIELKETGQLESPILVGKKLAHLLFSKGFVNGGFIDLRGTG
ncbi:MAG TPA: (S)-benzoin forming benzil reductase [Bacteroidales bacterium]|nr:(S)-benzoin forming benzil reductase [Bacteroidales bacterium]